MTAEYLLQECPTYEEKRKKTWITTIPTNNKLNGDGHNLQLTANYLRSIQVDI
jgi:hypothetical protein